MRRRAIARSTLGLVSAVLLLLGGPGAQLGASAAQTDDPGQPGPQASGIHVDARQVPPPPRGDTPDQVRQIPRQYPVDQGSFDRLKGQANAAAAARDHGLRGGSTTGPTPRFAGLGMGDAGNWNPPDAGLAVGPSDVLVAVNEAFAVYDRGGNQVLSPRGFQSFFGTSGSTFDPRALYDAAQGRFVLSATAGGVYALAVSRTSDPTGGWCTYRLTVDRTGGTWADFPGLGMDGDYLYITSNQFQNGSNRFKYAQVLAIRKASVYGGATGACPTSSSTLFTNLQNPGGGTAFTVQPANEPDAAPGQNGPMYFVNAIWSSGSNLALRAITHTSNGLALSAAQWVASGFIAPYDLPANAPQPSGSAIATGDTRLLGAVYRYGTVYTANTTKDVSNSLSASANPYANSQWYSITPNALSNSVGASSAVANPGVAYFFPGVLPGCATVSNGSCSAPLVALEVSGSGATQSASAFSVIGSGSPTVFAQGVVGYTQNGRWGDYPAMAADPSSAASVWMLGEYAASSGTWGTAVNSVS
jgi:hypothetical protein